MQFKNDVVPDWFIEEQDIRVLAAQDQSCECDGFSADYPDKENAKVVGVNEVQRRRLLLGLGMSH